MIKSTESKILSPTDIANRMGISKQTLKYYRWKGGGKMLKGLPMFKLCGCKGPCNHPYYVTESDFDDWVANKRSAGI